MKKTCILLLGILFIVWGGSIGCDGGSSSSSSSSSSSDGCDGGSSSSGDTVDIPEGDPGTAPFIMVPDNRVADECKLDADLLNRADRTIGAPYLVVRYGKLCHQYLPDGRDTSEEVWSATKSLGGVVTGIASYETRNFTKMSRRGTGQLVDTDRVDHWLSTLNYDYNDDALIAHVLAMVAHNRDLNNGNMEYQ